MSEASGFGRQECNSPASPILAIELHSHPPNPCSGLLTLKTGSPRIAGEAIVGSNLFDLKRRAVPSGGRIIPKALPPVMGGPEPIALTNPGAGCRDLSYRFMARVNKLVKGYTWTGPGDASPAITAIICRKVMFLMDL